MASPFGATWTTTRDELLREADHLGADLVVLEVDAQRRHIRRDGEIKADARLLSATVPLDLSVPALAEYLRRHLDWITRQSWVDEMARELRGTRDQLRPATGDPRPRPVGRCPNTIDEGETTRECGAPLRVPLYGDAVHCPRCGRTWSRAEWLTLGNLIESEA